MREAAYQGDVEGVRACLEAGADPNSPAPEMNGMTAMHDAAVGAGDSGALEVLVLLWKWGAEVDKVNKDGETPLMYAAYYGGTVAVLRWLLEQGADWRLQATSGEYAGETALGFANRFGTAEAASVLAAWVSEHGSAEEAAAAAAVAHHSSPMSKKQGTEWRIKSGNEALWREDAIKRKVWHWWRKKSAPQRYKETPKAYEARQARLIEEKAGWGAEMNEAYGKLDVITPEKRLEIARELAGSQAHKNMVAMKLKRGDNAAVRVGIERAQRAEQQEA